MGRYPTERTNGGRSDSSATTAPVALAAVAVFVGFFALAGVAIRYRHHRSVRLLFVVVIAGAFFAPLAGIHFVPFSPYLLYTQAAAEEQTMYEVRVVDASGDELLYDGRAAPPMTGPSLNWLAQSLASECDDERVRRLSEHLISEAREYRRAVTRSDGVSAEAAAFPRHNLDFEWSEATVREYAAFEAVRVYRFSVESAANGRQIENRTETMMLEVQNSNGAMRITEDERRGGRCS